MLIFVAIPLDSKLMIHQLFDTRSMNQWIEHARYIQIVDVKGLTAKKVYVATHVGSWAYLCLESLDN